MIFAIGLIMTFVGFHVCNFLDNVRNDTSSPTFITSFAILVFGLIAMSVSFFILVCRYMP